jgi:single-strand selective monofunctional uracil DNA glycosylase
MDLVSVSRRLSQKLNRLKFSEPVSHVYNPLVYARATWENYLVTYAKKKVGAVLLGMNPGPFGMAQTGVPFGEINAVAGWLKIHGPVKKPNQEHPKRLVEGFACKRSEVSGSRIWTWAQKRYGSPKKFFQKFFILNYCPLLFLEQSGRNRTPDKLPKKERQALLSICDASLTEMVKQIQPTYVIGVGAFAEKQAIIALSELDVNIGRILHPSPASPLANRGWADQAEQELKGMGLSL